MLLIPAGRPIICALLGLLVAGTAMANGRDGEDQRFHGHVAARPLAPDIRYRDPRYVPPRHRASSFGTPDFLIHAYLPRTTERPIYNEPPPRFPSR